MWANATAVRVVLPPQTLVKPGETVAVELICEYTLPNTQGRLGYFEGVSFLTNSTPLLAYCDDTGWQPKPFIPWHQPWFNEAGEFRATITLPDNEVLATPAATKSVAQVPNLGGSGSRRRLSRGRILPFSPLRDSRNSDRRRSSPTGKPFPSTASPSRNTSSMPARFCGSRRKQFRFIRNGSDLIPLLNSRSWNRSSAGMATSARAWS